MVAEDQHFVMLRANAFYSTQRHVNRRLIGAKQKMYMKFNFVSRENSL